jgi:hypothetical protein
LNLEIAAAVEPDGTKTVGVDAAQSLIVAVRCLPMLATNAHCHLQIRKYVESVLRPERLGARRAIADGGDDAVSGACARGPIGRQPSGIVQMELIAVKAEADIMAGEKAFFGTQNPLQVEERPVSAGVDRIASRLRVAGRVGPAERRALVGLQISEIRRRHLEVEEAARVRLHRAGVDQHFLLHAIVAAGEALQRRRAQGSEACRPAEERPVTRDEIVLRDRCSARRMVRATS